MLGLITYAGLLIALAIATMLRPAIAVAGVLCLFGIKQWGQSSTAVFAAHPLVTNLVIGVLVLVGIARRAVKQSCVFCQFPLSAWLVAAIYGYAFITTLWAPDSQSSLAEWVRLGPYIVTVTVLAPLLLSDLADIRIAFQWTVYVGGAVCLLALVFGKWGFRGLLLNGDLYETETNPLALASLGGVVLLAAATLMLQKKHLVLKIINIACIPLALAVILKSGSRGQLLATGPAFVVAWLIAFRLKNVGSVAALLLTACFVVGIGVWAATIVEVDSSRWASNQTHEDVAGRLAMAQTLLGAAFASPGTILFGIGNSSSFQILGIYPHITILEVIAEEGLIGTTLYLAVLAIALRSIIRIARSLADDETARSTLAILASLFCFELILTWKQGSLLSSYYVFAYTIILGRMETPAAVKVSIERVTSPVAGLRLFPNLMR